MRTAGVIFDFYDDVSGSLLKKACPTAADLPEIVKEAHILSPEEHEVLRDEAYALTMVNNGTPLRKFACVDAGNTALSVLYFSDTADLLPHAAVKVAAANLVEACEDFELPVPGWLKTAAKTGMSKTRNPSKQPQQSDDVEWSQRTNLNSVQGGADSGRVIPTASQMKTAQDHAFSHMARVKGAKKKDVNLDSFHKLNPEAKPKEKKAVSGEWIRDLTRSGAQAAHAAGNASKVSNFAARNSMAGMKPAGKALTFAQNQKHQVAANAANSVSSKMASAETTEKLALSPGMVNSLAQSGARKNPLKGFQFMNRMNAKSNALYDTAKKLPQGTGARSKVLDRAYNAREGALGAETGYKANRPSAGMKSDARINAEVKYNPQGKYASVVDVSEAQEQVLVKRASAELTALGGKYPLDSMADVQKAAEYFETNYKEMEPVEAHIFAVKTAARAEEIGVPTSHTLQRYGSIEYAIDVDAHMANRLAVTPLEYREVYQELREKRASIEPETFANLLAEADEISGLRWVWGGDVADPYYATFGKQANAWSWTGRTGDFTTEEELKWLAKNGRPLVHKHFSSEFTDSFIKDPITIFESMPDDSKVILSRLASGRFDAMNAN